MIDAERRARALLAAGTGCLAALTGALAIFWAAWLVRGQAPGNPYGARAHGFALLGLAMCLFHGAATRGIAWTLAVLAGAWAVGLGAELLGVQTGLVFGRYRYTDAVPARILGLVPAVVPVAWAMLLYLAWAVSGARWPAAGRQSRLLARAGLAAALFVAYDLAADPNHLHRGGWVYEGGGAYYGVPVHNFAGWATVSFLAFCAAGWLESRWREPTRPLAGSPWAGRLPAVAYAVIAAHEAMFALIVLCAWLPGAIALAAGAAALGLAAGRPQPGTSRISAAAGGG